LFQQNLEPGKANFKSEETGTLKVGCNTFWDTEITTRVCELYVELIQWKDVQNLGGSRPSAKISIKLYYYN